MRIAEISTLARPVPPPGEGSIESLVSVITEGLVRRGHEVTLFATADSKTSARLQSPVEGSYAGDPSKWDWQLYESFQVSEAFRRFKEFDVIHCHAYHFGLLYCDWVPIPSLHTIHIEPGPDYLFLARRTRNRHLQLCSSYQAREFAGLPGVHVIPHGIDIESFKLNGGVSSENYLAFLGRLIPEKGLLQAVEFARASGVPLKIAGPPTDYFRKSIEPLVDGRLIQYVGAISAEKRAGFLSAARALIYPLQRGEPFGLVLVEAMACGLPVIATNCGAVSEIIQHGKNGWVGDSAEDWAAGLQAADRMDRAAIRRMATENFSSERMVDSIEDLLRKIVEGARA